MVATEWGGTSRMGEGERTGRVLMVDVHTPSAGKPERAA